VRFGQPVYLEIRHFHNREDTMKTSCSRHLAVIFALAVMLGFGVNKTQAASASDGTGIGFILGTPSGFSLKLPQGPGNAWQFALGYDLDGGPHWGGPPWHDHDPRGTHFYLGGDYLWYNY